MKMKFLFSYIFDCFSKQKTEKQKHFRWLLTSATGISMSCGHQAQWGSIRWATSTVAPNVNGCCTEYNWAVLCDMQWRYISEILRGPHFKQFFSFQQNATVQDKQTDQLTNKLLILTDHSLNPLCCLIPLPPPTPSCLLARLRIWK